MFQGEPGQMPGRGIDSAFLDQEDVEDVSQTYQVEEVPSLVGGRNMGKGMGRALARKKLRNSRLLSSREGFTNSF